MRKVYDHKAIEKKWQRVWDEKKVFQTDNDTSKKKKYILDMFPYPSGAGLHVGHPLGYIASDIVSRYYRMNGYRVLHPMGWDAFGLPAENYAIKSGIHPDKITKSNIKTFKRQLRSLGFSYDWSREINTSDPEYYKWTQWIFLKLFEKGLAYKKKALVNWCDSCQTVLANEQVIDGKCERCKKSVIQKELKQWFFKITDYAEELLADIEKLNWSESIKSAQRNWIGKSKGATIKFEIDISNSDGNSKSKKTNLKQILNTNNQISKQYIEVFTTRPDTLFGATYLVCAPEHKQISNFKFQISNWNEVEKYIEESKKKTDLQRSDLSKEKTGVEIKGFKAINPVNNKEIPIWIADYVLNTYGTGAIMAVPAHDERDFEFASKYNIEIIKVIEGGKLPYTGKGKMVNSGKFNGQQSDEIIKKITRLTDGKLTIQYKLRDWLISRQRYWGVPIPIIYCANCGIIPVPEDQLPVELPTDVDFIPNGESPLTNSKTFHAVKCPNCDSPARRESDTMDTFVDSSWYFLAYTTDKISNFKFSRCFNRDLNINESSEQISTANHWLPVDIYVGGAEHAVMHLLYARFITKVLRDIKILDFNEPFMSLKNQGMILAEDGRKMSKSFGNVINPDDIVDVYGADTFRLYEMFIGPFSDTKSWSTKNIAGVNRFIKKLFNIEYQNDGTIEEYTKIKIEQLKKSVSDDILNFSFNTAIAKMMSFIKDKNLHLNKKFWQEFLILFSPFAPYASQELWAMTGEKGLIVNENWVKIDKLKLNESTKDYMVIIGGKKLGSLKLITNISDDEIIEEISKDQIITDKLNNKKIEKIKIHENVIILM